MTVGNSNSDSPGRILETFPVRTICVLAVAALWAPMAFAQTDPGPRSGPPSAGGPLQGLGPNELAFFTAAQTNFQEVETFKGGLGPRMNLNQCSGCHSQPAVGGSSPTTNPQIAFASMLGPPNAIPSFISLSGPVREVRFVTNPNGTPDGGVHNLFVVTPAVGAPATCKLVQPNFAQALKQSNIIFRIPTPLFGAGLVENLNDAQLTLSFNANAAMGISGHFNTSGNDGTITKFGWKAQNKSLLVFAGEAYNIEMGVTNDIFPNERETDPNCATNPTPESTTNLTNPDGSIGAPAGVTTWIRRG
jgi:Di-haem oxidoreductase, putative peroxidase